MQPKRIHQGYRAIAARYDTKPRRVMYLAQKGEIPVFWIGRTPCLLEEDAERDLAERPRATQARKAPQQG
jgi:hypothetical protein